MAKDTRAIQPYEVTEYEGKEARRYPNGVIRSPKGYVLYVPPDVAREMRHQRTQQGEEQAREGIKLATQSESPEEAVMKIIRAKTIVAMTDNGRAGNDAAKLVLTASGFMSPERSVQVSGTVQHQPALPELPQKFLEFVKHLAEKQEPDVIEGETYD